MGWYKHRLRRGPVQKLTHIVYDTKAKLIHPSSRSELPSRASFDVDSWPKIVARSDGEYTCVCVYECWPVSDKRGDRPQFCSEYIRNKHSVIDTYYIFVSDCNAFCRRSLWMKIPRLGRHVCWSACRYAIAMTRMRCTLVVGDLVKPPKEECKSMRSLTCSCVTSILMYVFYSVVVLVRV